MKTELNQVILTLMKEHPEYSILDALNHYLTSGNTARYLFPTEKSKLIFKRQQLKIYYQELRKEYEQQVVILTENRKNKKMVRTALEEIRASIKEEENGN